MQLQPILIQIDHPVKIVDLFDHDSSFYFEFFNLKSDQYFLIDTGEKETIGIDEIKNFLMPLYLVLEKKTFAIINNAQFLSIEAQNFLLKTLEEPIDNLQLILIEVTPNLNQKLLLETIYSRCIVHKRSLQNHDQQDETPDINVIINNFLNIFTEKNFTIDQIVNYLNLFLKQSSSNYYHDDFELVQFISNCIDKKINSDIILNLLLFKIYLKERNK